MSTVCNPSSYKYDFSINIALHITILFLILSLFFMLYVSKLVKSNINEELTNLIKQNFNKTFDSLNAEEQKTLKLALKDLPFDNFINLFSTPDSTVEVYNKWLFTMIIAVNIFLFVITILLISLPYIECNKCVPITHILTENLVIFAFVGLVEFLFFYFIAKNYIPAPPSLMIDTIILSIKKYL